MERTWLNCVVPDLINGLHLLVRRRVCKLEDIRSRASRHDHRRVLTHDNNKRADKTQRATADAESSESLFEEDAGQDSSVSVAKLVSAQDSRQLVVLLTR